MFYNPKQAANRLKVASILINLMPQPLPNTTSLPPVAIVITAWNQIQVTAECLASVLALSYASFEVIVVDNGSTPSLAPYLRNQFPQVHFLRHNKNMGFAAGYNLGLQYALEKGFEYVFLLNNDTLVEPSCLSELVAALQNEPDVSLVMPKIYYADDVTRIWSVGANYRPVLRELKDDWRGTLDEACPVSTRPRQIEFAPFCAVLLRREVLETIGLLDEQFFLYYEDLDYCRRMGAVGYRLQMIPTAVLWHKVSVSTGGWHSPLERFWVAQSSGHYFRRHGRGWRLFFIVPYRLGSALRLTATLLWRRQWRTLRAYWQGLRYGWLGTHARTAPPRWVLVSKPE